jgi:hypothetical protein
MKDTPYNKLIQDIHDAAANCELYKKSKRTTLEFYYGYAVALFDHGIITEGQYRTARDYCWMCMKVNVNKLIIPLNAR